MGNKSAIVSMLICALVMANPVRAEAPPKEAYAYGFPIKTQDQADVYQIELPLTVHQSVADPLLRDLGVYDGAGRPVPRVLRNYRAQQPTQQQKIALNTFALPGTDPPTGDEIHLLLRRSEDETSVEFNAAPNAAGEPVPSMSYIIDVKQIEESLSALEFQWKPTDETFLGLATVTGSNDLINWQPAGKGAVVSMREAEADIVQRRATLLGRRYDYLRVVFDGVPETFALSKTVGLYDTSEPEMARRWLERSPTATDSDGGLIFDLGGSPLIDGLHVRLPADNVVIRGTLSYRSAKGDRWVQSHQGLFYHLRRVNHEVQNTPVTIPQRRASVWKLTIETGRKDVQVKLAFGWRPDRLVFVAQGQGPYTLAVGSAADALHGFPQEFMFGDRAILNLISDSNAPAMASIGDRFDLGGTGALTVTRQIQWRTVTLWATLIFGVALVAWMVYSLVRQLRAGDS